MKDAKITPALVVIAIVALATVSVLPPLILNKPLLWFVTVPLAMVSLAGILFRRNFMLLLAGALLVLALPVAGLVSGFSFTPEQEQKFEAMGYFVRAETYYLRGDYSEALDSYIRSQQMGLLDPWLDFQRAYCYNFLGQHRPAMDIFRELMRDPSVLSYDMTLVNFAISAMRSSDYEEGEEAFREALRYNFRPGYCYFQLGISYRLRGDSKLAEEMMINAHRLEHNPSECSSILGAIYEGRRDYVRAEEFYRRGIREDKENLTLYTKLGSLLARQDRTADAKEILMEGGRVAAQIPVNPSDYAYLLNNLGYVYAETGEIGMAVRSFKEAIRINPQYMDSYDNLAHLYVQLGDFYNAQLVLRAALKVSPDHASAQKMLEEIISPPDTIRQ